MIFKLLRILSFLLLVVGLFRAYSILEFTRNAVTVGATVIPAEEYRGPPKSAHAIPVKVVYVMPDGAEHQTELPSPLIRKLSVGDHFPLLVSSTDPQVVKLPFLSDLWSYPLGLLGSAFGLFIFSTAALKVNPTRWQKVPGNT